MSEKENPTTVIDEKKKKMFTINKFSLITFIA